MDNEVGYGKPPIETRFQEGVSGNPSGKPKGAVSLQFVIRKWLEMPHGKLTLPDGRIIDLSKQDEMVRKQILKAIDEGDTSAMKTVFEFAYGKAIQITENIEIKLSPEEELLRTEQRMREMENDWFGESKNGGTES